MLVRHQRGIGRQVMMARICDGCTIGCLPHVAQAHPYPQLTLLECRAIGRQIENQAPKHL